MRATLFALKSTCRVFFLVSPYRTSLREYLLEAILLCNSFLPQASVASNRERLYVIYVNVSPVHFEDDDLRDLGQHISYHKRGKWGNYCINNFFAAIPLLRIKLCKETPIEMQLQIGL